MKTKSSKIGIYVSALLFLAMALGLAMPLQTARAQTGGTPSVTFVGGGPTGTAAWTAEQANSGLRSAKMTTTTIDDRGAVRFDFAPGALTLDDLTTFSYWEYVSARANPLDVFIDIWLDVHGTGIPDTIDWDGYMQAEPYYTVGAAPLNTWTQINVMNLKWTTAAGPDDPSDAPTIAEFQANVHPPCAHGYTMTNWTNGVDFGPLSILRIDIRVGYGSTWANFTGYADDIVINSYTQGFEPLAEVRVDDDFTTATPGWGYDAFAKIQDGVYAVSPNGTVNVAAGSYTEQVTITKSLDLIGAGEGSTTILAPSTRTGSVTSVTTVTTVHDYLLAAYAPSGTIDVRIQGFTLDVNGQNKTAGTAQMDGVFFRDVKDTGGTMAGLFSITIHNFVPTLYLGFGVVVYGDSLLTVNDNDISDYTRDGIGINRRGIPGGLSPNVTISGNTVTGTAEALNGISVDTVTAGAVTGNTVTGNSGNVPMTWASGGIVLWSSTGVPITGNHVDGNFYGIDLYNGSHDITISGNELTGNIKRGISLGGDTLGAHVGTNDNIVSGNTIIGPASGTDDVGIGLANVSTGNMIGGPTPADGNTITMATTGSGNRFGVHVEGSVGTGNSIQYNTITGGGYAGIVIDTGAAGQKINNNYVHDNLGGGFAINAQAAEFNNNRSLDNGFGIEMGATGATFVLHNNSIAGNDPAGTACALYGVCSSGLSVYDGTANAENNWWGSMGGPSAGQVSANVDYTPWCGDSDCTPSAQVISGASATLDSTSSTVSLPDDVATATYSGTGSPTVTLAQYTDNPGGAVTDMLLGADSNFYDVHVTNNTDTNATLTVVFNAKFEGDVLRYWNGSAWNTVISNDSKIPTAQAGPPIQITVVFGPNSQPPLSALTGTPIVSSSPEAIAIQFTQAQIVHQIVQGQQIEAKVIVSSTNLYGVEVHLTFPVTLLQVIQVIPGGDLFADASVLNNYDNTNGKIDFAFTQTTPPHTAISGDDLEVATILFIASDIYTGSATVDYSTVNATILTNGIVETGRYGGSGTNTMDAQTDSVEVVQLATIVGTVRLQGRSDYNGITISVLPGINLQATTGNSGSFSLSRLIPDGIAGVSSIYDIRASLAGYLTAQKSGYKPTAGSNTPLPTITLLGGDATHDQLINIQDLAYMGSRFGNPGPSPADINSDGIVNILDLTLAGTNFGQGQFGPQGW